VQADPRHDGEDIGADHLGDGKVIIRPTLALNLANPVFLSGGDH
jgi:hypothetical protein